MTDPEVINNIVMRALGDVHTIQLGRVEVVNATTIDVQPVVKKVLNGSIVDMPLFKDVPPISIQGGSSFEIYPITKGDYCLLFVAEVCIDRWYMGEDDLEPNEDRRFDYSDSFALVGVNALANALTIPTVTTANGDKIITGDYFHTGNNTHIGNNLHTGNYTQVGVRTHTGAEVVTGITTQAGDIILNGVSLKDYISPSIGHDHGGVASGISNTNPPNPF